MNRRPHDHLPPLSPEQVRALLPTLDRITRRAAEAVELRLDRLGKLPGAGNLDTIDELVHAWFDDVRRLGGVARGLWMVEFRSEGGWFGWVRGEKGVGFYRPIGTPPKARSRLH